MIEGNDPVMAEVMNGSVKCHFCVFTSLLLEEAILHLRS